MAAAIPRERQARRPSWRRGPVVPVLGQLWALPKLRATRTASGQPWVEVNGDLLTSYRFARVLEIMRQDPRAESETWRFASYFGAMLDANYDLTAAELKAVCDAIRPADLLEVTTQAMGRAALKMARMIEDDQHNEGA